MYEPDEPFDDEPDARRARTEAALFAAEATLRSPRPDPQLMAQFERVSVERAARPQPEPEPEREPPQAPEPLAAMPAVRREIDKRIKLAVDALIEVSARSIQIERRVAQLRHSEAERRISELEARLAQLVEAAEPPAAQLRVAK